MHYYKRNLGDYAKKAGRLTMLQHGAYTLLIDACYDREQFPTLDEAIDWCWASNDAEVDAVKFVLSKFFTLDGDRFVQNRIKEEVAAYHQKSETNKRIANEREAIRKINQTKREHTVDESCIKENESSPNHKPLTINHKPIEKKDSLRESKENSEIRFVPPTLEQVYAECQNRNESEKFWNYYESNGWRVGKNKMKSWRHALAGWIKRSSEQHGRGGLVAGDLIGEGSWGV